MARGGAGGKDPLQTGLQRAKPFFNKAGTTRYKLGCKGRSPFSTRPVFAQSPRQRASSILLPSKEVCARGESLRTYVFWISEEFSAQQITSLTVVETTDHQVDKGRCVFSDVEP